MDYIEAPKYINLFDEFKSILLSEIDNQETISKATKKRLKLPKKSLRYYKVKDSIKKSIENKMNMSVDNINLLVTPSDYKTHVHKDLGKRDIVLNIVIKGAGTTHFINEKTDSKAFFFNSKKDHYVDNTNNDCERIVLSISWWKKFTLEDLINDTLFTD